MKTLFDAKTAVLTTLAVCAVSASWIRTERVKTLDVAIPSFSAEMFVSEPMTLCINLESSLLQTMEEVAEYNSIHPTRCHDRIRKDRNWMLSDIPLGLTVQTFLARVPTARMRHRVNAPQGNTEVGTLVGGDVVGYFDFQQRVRGLRGDTLTCEGNVVVRLGDRTSMLERRLGSPMRTDVPWGERHALEWHYEYQSVSVGVLVRKGVVEKISLRERNFRFGGPNC